MKTKEFNLSEKMFNLGIIEEELWIRDKDVKEFIRLLKDKVENNNSLFAGKVWVRELDVLDWIDTLAGEKLK